MKKIIIISLLVSLLVVVVACVTNLLMDENIKAEGVSRELAIMRQRQISDVEYNLHFNLPAERNEDVTGDVEIVFKITEKQPIIIDFAANKDAIKKVEVNGVSVNYIYENEHIIIDEKYSTVGDNRIRVIFTSTNRALNRRDDFMYTLLVPDRARTLFPLFDQPSLKARYKLSLTLPKNWVGVANSRMKKEVELKDKDGYKKIFFDKSEPISSYLFSFVAGVFQSVEKEHKGRVHRIYHREDDPQRTAQFDDIFSELFHSLDWLEDYTAIKYPFSKYDLILIPGFQYGGMEHVGATIYRASIMFLSPTSTIDERLSRAKLIAHETAHMWFGDYVTMDWFDDVWTKEVFANYFAAKIIAPMFPNMDSSQSMIGYSTAAMSEDRTMGGTAIKQNLDNLRYAGLVYNNIIYNKSPIVFEMLANLLGEDVFKTSVREYLNKYAYSSATWEQLVDIFDENSDIDVKKWSSNWMYQSGMPIIAARSVDNGIYISQFDSKGRNLLWGQNVRFTVVDKNLSKKNIDVYINSADTLINLGYKPLYVIPNTDGRAYGYFKLDNASLNILCENLYDIFDSPVARRIAINTIYEQVINQNIPREHYIEVLGKFVTKEKEPIIISTILRYIDAFYADCLDDKSLKAQLCKERLDEVLWRMCTKHKDTGCRYMIFKSIYTLQPSDNTEKRVYDIWKNKLDINGFKLAERDFINMSLELAVRNPSMASDIVAEQLSRIINPDTRQEYEFISRSVASNEAERTVFFKSLLDVDNRRVESWVQTSLAYLTHKAYSDSLRTSYIRPALDCLTEIQRTGDIFFPQGWCSSLLRANNSEGACREVEKFLKDNPTLHPMLQSKVLISSDHLMSLYGVKNMIHNSDK